jgi:hypothetical protein
MQMTNSGVRFRAGPLLEEFIGVLAQHCQITAKEIHEMFSSCILCQDAATVAALGLDRDAWFAESQPESLEFLLYGLCARCSALPDLKERTEAIIFGRARIC